MNAIKEPSIREQIETLEEEIAEKKKEVTQLKKKMVVGKVDDWTLTDGQGKAVALSSLFGEHNELLVIHNMGKSCPYCTLWADGLNGVFPHLNNRIPTVITSPDPPARQREFAESRNWIIPVFSTEGTGFKKQLGYEDEKGNYWPGVSVLVKNDQGDIVEVAKDFFGPGDPYCSVWHLLDLLPDGVNNWEPKYTY